MLNQKCRMNPLNFLLSLDIPISTTKKIMQKHWKVLRGVQVLGSILHEQPRVVYQGVPPLKLQVAPNIVDPSRQLPFFQSIGGFYPCRRCPICKLNANRSRRIDSFQSTSTQEIFPIKPFITCCTKYVVYVIKCPCSKQYIGRTKRILHVRLGEHVANIKHGFSKHSLSKHYALKHDCNPEGTTFLGINKFCGHKRGSDSNMVREVSRLETRWIYQAQTYTPFSMNIEWAVNAFINNG